MVCDNSVDQLVLDAPARSATLRAVSAADSLSLAHDCLDPDHQREIDATSRIFGNYSARRWPT